MNLLYKSNKPKFTSIINFYPFPIPLNRLSEKATKILSETLLELQCFKPDKPLLINPQTHILIKPLLINPQTYRHTHTHTHKLHKNCLY